MKFKIVKSEKLAQKDIMPAQLATDIENATDFIKNIENGNLDTEYAGRKDSALLSEDSLAVALISMRNHMKSIAEKEKERNWTTEGLAKFIDILRNTNESVEQLYQKIISSLVKYLGINQGALYILNDDKEGDEHIEMVACYAYDKRKYVSKRIELGEGLIGQAFLEKDTIYMTNLPDKYIQITSGLGTANPSSLLIVPLKINEQVYGLIELASFKEFRTYQREFVEKLGESIASAISSAKMNARTQSLLEVSQVQTEQMRAQEEEMRQNLEELEATQEEMQRKIIESAVLQQELNTRMNVLSAAALMSETDAYGTITYVNDKFCEVGKWKKEDMIGKPHNIVRHPETPKEVFKEMWETIKSGRIFRGTYRNMAKDGSTYWVEATVAPVLGEDGKPVKYIGVRFDITDQVNKSEQVKELLDEANQYTEELRAQEEELRQNLEELRATQEEIHRQASETSYLKKELEARERVFNLTTILSESDLYGTITHVNETFCRVSKYSEMELLGKPHSIVRHPDMPKEIFKLCWDTIQSGQVFRGIIKNRAKDGTPYWVDAVISPVLDDDGKPYKYIGARYVITDHTIAETLYARMLEDLKEKQLVQI